MHCRPLHPAPCACRQCLPHQPPNRLGLRRLRVRLARDPGVDRRLHLRIKAQADIAADAGRRAAPTSFFGTGYCTAPDLVVPGNTVSAAEHNPLRRALLGVAVALPFIGRGGPRLSRESGGPSPSPGRDSEGWIPDQVRDDGKWGRALPAFRTVEAELSAFEVRTAGAPDAAQEAVELEMDARLDALGPALLRLLGAPVPDLEALVVKIETIVAHEAWSVSGGEDCLVKLCRDTRRLAGK